MDLSSHSLVSNAASSVAMFPSRTPLLVQWEAGDIVPESVSIPEPSCFRLSTPLKQSVILSFLDLPSECLILNGGTTWFTITSSEFSRGAKGSTPKIYTSTLFKYHTSQPIFVRADSRSGSTRIVECGGSGALSKLLRPISGK